MADQDPNIEQTRAAAERAGFQLTEAELAKLAKDVTRDRALAGALRRYATGDVEPAGVFHAGASHGR